MAGTAIPETRPETRPDVDIDFDVLRQVRQLRPHKVVVIDCMCHSFDDVERALCRFIPRMTWERAHEHAYEIHTTGASVVAVAPKEEAEHFGNGLRSRGLRVRVEEDT
jgi:ATP-dependent Clp protease adapter protein ClpS